MNEKENSRMQNALYITHRYIFKADITSPKELEVYDAPSKTSEIAKRYFCYVTKFQNS